VLYGLNPKVSDLHSGCVLFESVLGKGLANLTEASPSLPQSVQVDLELLH
jgi:hypothetical protein